MHAAIFCAVTVRNNAHWQRAFVSSMILVVDTPLIALLALREIE
jgi:hypothetical protein